MLENIPLFNAMNECEVKSPFPKPHRPLTAQESHFAIMEKVNACINEVNHFEQRVKCEMDNFMDKTGAENSAFKNAIQESYNAFQQAVQHEINNFETEMKADFTLFTNDVDLRIANFETAINNEFVTLQTNVLKASNDKIAEMETLKTNLNKGYNDFKAVVNESVENFKTQVNERLTAQDNDIIKYKNYMVDNILESTETIFEQKAENGEIAEIMREVYGEESVFLGSKSYDEIQADTTATNGSYYFCTTDNHYYKRTSTAWVDIGNKDRISDDYETYKINNDVKIENILSQIGKVEVIAKNKGVLDDGTQGDANLTTVTDYVKVVPNTSIMLMKIHLVGKRGVCGYDENKKFVECFATNSDATTLTLTVPSNVHYLRFNGIGEENPVLIANYNTLISKETFKPFASVKTNSANTPIVTENEIYFETDTNNTLNHSHNIWLEDCKDVGYLEMTITASDTESSAFAPRFFVQDVNTKEFYFYVLGRDNSTLEWNLAIYKYRKNSYAIVENIAIEENKQTSSTTLTNCRILNDSRDDMEYRMLVVFKKNIGYLYVRKKTTPWCLLTHFNLPTSDKIIAGWNLRSIDNRVRLTNMKVVNKNESPFVHFSVDDVYVCLKDLEDNKNVYSSIFDSPYFAKLKELHLKYGCVFSLYVFKTGTNFDLATITLNDTFKSEFVKCRDWLKFSFHSKESGYKYTSTSELVTDYNATIECLIALSSKGNIDYVPRFENFNVPRLAYSSLRSETNIKGLLTADDEREENAGLVAHERRALNCGDYFYHYYTHLFRTTPRLDGKSEEEIKAIISNEIMDARTKENLIVFMHEGTDSVSTNANALNKFETVCEFLKNHNYKYDFPQNNLPKF